MLEKVANKNADDMAAQLLENVRSEKFNVIESHKIKQILQEYSRKLKEKSYSRGTQQQVNTFLNSLVDGITTSVESHLPADEIINYRSLGKSYAEYITLKDRGKILYGDEKFKGLKVVDDIIKAHTDVMEGMKYPNTEKLPQIIAEGNRAYTQYIEVVSNLKKFGFAPEAQELEKSLNKSISGITEIGVLDDFLKTSEKNISRLDSEILTSLKNEITGLKQQKQEVLSEKRGLLKKVNARNKERSRELAEKVFTGKQEIETLIGTLPDARKTKAYHVLSMANYAGAILPPGAKELVKGSALLLVLKDFFPQLANGASRIVAKTGYLTKIKKTGMTAQAAKTLDALSAFLMSENTKGEN